MYDQTFSRRDPGCLVFLLDRSDSMKRPWHGASGTLAQGAARAINAILDELCTRSTKEMGGAPRHYFDVGIFGYGIRPVASGEGVESAFGGALAGQGLVALPDLGNNPLAMREEPSLDAGMGSATVPIWVEPVHGYRTPMCEAISVAGYSVHDWTAAHPDSFPPIVINITDGLVTDSPYEGATLEDWAKRVSTIETNDGQALLLNIFLSPDPEPAVLFPTTGHGLPDPGPQLFEISSPLPPPMIENARSAGVAVEPGAHGLGFNADLPMLVKFLEIGTRVEQFQDR